MSEYQPPVYKNPEAKKYYDSGTRDALKSFGTCAGGVVSILGINVFLILAIIYAARNEGPQAMRELGRVLFFAAGTGFMGMSCWSYAKSGIAKMEEADRLERQFKRAQLSPDFSPQ